METPPRVKRAHDENKWDQLDLLEVRKRVATLAADTEWAVVEKKRALLEGAILHAMIAANV